MTQILNSDFTSLYPSAIIDSEHLFHRELLRQIIKINSYLCDCQIMDDGSPSDEIITVIMNKLKELLFDDELRLFL
jgi:hypothetical protein